MADGSESEDNRLSAKSVKRVRFSDEVKRVEIFEESDDSSLSFENESASIFPTSIEIPDDVGNKDCTDNYSVQENCDDASFVEADSNNNRELLDDTQNVKEAHPSSLSNTDSLNTEFSAQHCENMQVISVEINESSQESPEMMDLIHETKSLTISPASLAKFTADSLGDVKESQLSFSQEDKKSKDPFIVTKETSTAPLSRKRSLEGVLLQKQSTKLNSCLRKNNLEISSADRLKDAVFNAWNEVKNDTTEIKSSVIHISTIAEKEKNNAKCPQSSNKAYEMWRRSKVKSKKTKKSTETALQSSQKSKSTEDLEESKMV